MDLCYCQVWKLNVDGITVTTGPFHVVVAVVMEIVVIVVDIALLPTVEIVVGTVANFEKKINKVTLIRSLLKW